MQSLMLKGPEYGYFPAVPKKSFLVVKPESFEEAKAMFEPQFGLQVFSGQRFLGGFVGAAIDRDEYAY